MNMGNPQKLTMLDAKQYIYRMRNEKNAAARTCNSFITAIKYLFIFGLQKEWDDKLFPHLRSKNKLPVVLSRQELDALFSSFKSPAYRMIAIVMYSSGLRVSEAVRLRVGDIHRDTCKSPLQKAKVEKTGVPFSRSNAFESWNNTGGSTVPRIISSPARIIPANTSAFVLSKWRWMPL